MRGSKRQRKKERIGTRRSRRRVALKVDKYLQLLHRDGTFSGLGLTPPCGRWVDWVVWRFSVAKKEAP
jgi:carbonic anhydrase